MPQKEAKGVKVGRSGRKPKTARYANKAARGETVKMLRIARTIQRVAESRTRAIANAPTIAWQKTHAQRIADIKRRGPACPGWEIGSTGRALRFNGQTRRKP